MAELAAKVGPLPAALWGMDGDRSRGDGGATLPRLLLAQRLHAPQCPAGPLRLWQFAAPGCSTGATHER